MSFISRFVVISNDYGSGISSGGDTRKHLKEDATKAGYDDVNKYVLDLLTPACLYQECIADPFADRTLCTRYKELWLERKMAKNEVHKMIKEDAARGGHKDGYFFKKDPKYPKICSSLYEECVAKRGAENSLCKDYKEKWLQSKSVQNGGKVSWTEAEVLKMIKNDAAERRYR